MGHHFGTQMEGHLDGVVDGKWENDPMNLGNIFFCKGNESSEPTNNFKGI